eukprot:1348694-Pyramimonas_sp.AAC.1
MQLFQAADLGQHMPQEVHFELAEATTREVEMFQAARGPRSDQPLHEGRDAPQADVACQIQYLQRLVFGEHVAQRGQLGDMVTAQIKLLHLLVDCERHCEACQLFAAHVCVLKAHNLRRQVIDPLANLL